MSLNIFWVYISSFLGCSVVLVIMAKKFAGTLNAGGKKPLLQGGFFSVILSGIAYVSTYISDHLFTTFWILAGVFLIFGIIYVRFFHKKYFKPKKNVSDKENGMGELMFCLGLLFMMVFIFSALKYFLGNDKEFLFYPTLLSGIAFFIPLVFLRTFEAAINIPAPEYHSWVYPLDVPIELPDDVPGEKILVMAFEINKKAGDREKTNFRAKAPENMKLGDLYYHFINDYNEQKSETTIEFTDSMTNPYKWWFHVKPNWYSSHRILDPDLSMKDNAVRENSVIYCERFQTPIS